MAVEVIAIKCPNCGASLEISKDRKDCYCPYCGSTIVVDDGSYTVTHRIIDDAKIIKETAKAEALHKRYGLSTLAVRVILGIVVVLFITAGVIGIVGAIRGDEDPFGPLLTLLIMVPIVVFSFLWLYSAYENYQEQHAPLGKNQARLPISSELAESANVDDVVAQLRSSGFVNVGTVAVADINFITASYRKQGSIAKMIVAGDDEAEAGTVYPKDVSIILKYHSR